MNQARGNGKRIRRPVCPGLVDIRARGLAAGRIQNPDEWKSGINVELQTLDRDEKIY